ncbi:hypothetical protein ACJ51O_38425 (plasmid) [Burkholderia pyrrocinia]|uniref:hypothetical protein n=1 Tax=Burkholderia pyrrocinia TaxID=60550 RepID=UPI0038B5B4DE
MNHFTLLKHCAVATVILSAAVTAFAGGGGPAGRAYPAISTRQAAPESAETAAVTQTPAPASDTVQVKTRARVSAELLQAEQMGVVPAGRTAYPAGPVTIGRNQAQFHRAEAYWRAHDGLAAQQ